MSDKKYSLGAFIEGLQILSKYMENGLETNFSFSAEHDIVYFYVEGATVSAEDTEKLENLRFHVDFDSGNWAYNT